eukprot:Selendium_serpulae@DN5001_c0_g1_i1.p1
MVSIVILIGLEPTQSSSWALEIHPSHPEDVPVELNQDNQCPSANAAPAKLVMARADSLWAPPVAGVVESVVVSSSSGRVVPSASVPSGLVADGVEDPRPFVVVVTSSVVPVNIEVEPVNSSAAWADVKSDAMTSKAAALKNLILD